MCGKEYCGVCEEHAKTTGVDAWAHGQHHNQPTFGDYAQKCVATKLRRHTYQQMKHTDPGQVLLFPEFIRCGAQADYVREFARQARGHFEELTNKIPTFAELVRLYPFIASTNDRGGKREQRRRHARQRVWKEMLIVSFLTQNGVDALVETHLVVNQQLPWWAKALAANDQQPIPIAA